MTKRLLLILSTILAASGLFLAQDRPQTSAPEGSSTASDVDNQGGRRYRVGPGDLLDVRVFGQPDLNSTVEVDEDGNISSLPFIEEPIPAKCRNEKEIQKTITDAYAKYIVKPRISVRVLERHSRQPASIFGAVRTPKSMALTRRIRLHELLAAAGGITASASGTIQIMHTEPELCPEPEDIAENLVAKNSTASSTPTAYTDAKPAAKEPGIGELRIIQINTIKNGFGSEDPYVRPGDIVIVTEGLPVYVTGLVAQPGPIVLKDVGRSSTFSSKGLAELFRGMATSTVGIVPGRIPF
jgi:polysaccharide export outer membrane protein